MSRWKRKSDGLVVDAYGTGRANLDDIRVCCAVPKSVFAQEYDPIDNDTPIGAPPPVSTGSDANGGRFTAGTEPGGADGSFTAGLPRPGDPPLTPIGRLTDIPMRMMALGKSVDEAVRLLGPWIRGTLERLHALEERLAKADARIKQLQVEVLGAVGDPPPSLLAHLCDRVRALEQNVDPDRLARLERMVDARLAALEARSAVTIASAGALTAEEEWERRLEKLRAATEALRTWMAGRGYMDSDSANQLAGLEKALEIMEGKVVE